jgi:hypothetical protein
MSVEAKDMIFYGSADMREVDTGSQGGVIDKTKKIIFADLASTDTVSIVSSSASDTANITVTVYGRDSSGALQSEAENTNGVTKVPTAINFERILKAVGSGTAWATRVGHIAVMSDTPARSNTLQAGSTTLIVVLDSGASAVDNAYRCKVFRLTSGTYSGSFAEIVKYVGATKTAYLRTALSGAPSTDNFEICDGCVLEKALGTGAVDVAEVRRPFYNAAADESADKDFYEKIFLFNLNTATTLSNCTIQELATGVYAKVHFALCTAFGGTDSTAATNRVTAPASGIGSWYNDTDGAIDIQNSKNLTNNNGQGIWLHLDLAAGDSAANNTYDMQVNGQTV